MRGLLASARVAGRVGGGAALLAVLLLSGCTAAGPAAPSPAPTRSAAWPRLPGRELARWEVSGVEHVIVAVGDPSAAYPRARALLVDAGFRLTKDREATGGGDGQACTTALCVQFSATTDPRYGRSVAYEAFHSSGPAPG